MGEGDHPGRRDREGVDDAGPPEDGGEEEQSRQARAPWHFKVLLVGTVVYLGWRLYQGIGWLVHHL
jgi:hypothetical protein